MKNNKFKSWLYAIGTIAVLGFLFGWPIVNDPNRSMVKAWNEAGIGCLSGHSAAAKHIHQEFFINVDGESEAVSGDIGVVPGCMAEAHVHKDRANYIHVETLVSSTNITLGQFAVVYGKPLIREGYKLEVTVNGAVYAGNPSTMILEDKQQIVLNYTSEKPAQ